jgi:hypothetical protein
VKRVSAAVIVGVTLGLAGIAYASGAESAGKDVASLSRLHEVYAPQIYNAARLKKASVRCPAGEVVVSGGYILTGEFQAEGAPVPRALPVVTESHAQLSRVRGSPREVADRWLIIAVAPRGFTGKWGLQARAMCGKP